MTTRFANEQFLNSFGVPENLLSLSLPGDFSLDTMKEHYFDLEKPLSKLDPLCATQAKILALRLEEIGKECIDIADKGGHWEHLYMEDDDLLIILIVRIKQILDRVPAKAACSFLLLMRCDFPISVTPSIERLFLHGSLGHVRRIYNLLLQAYRQVFSELLYGGNKGYYWSKDDCSKLISYMEDKFYIRTARGFWMWGEAFHDMLSKLYGQRDYLVMSFWHNEANELRITDAKIKKLGLKLHHVKIPPAVRKCCRPDTLTPYRTDPDEEIFKNNQGGSWFKPETLNFQKAGSLVEKRLDLSRMESEQSIDNTRLAGKKRDTMEMDTEAKKEDPEPEVNPKRKKLERTYGFCVDKKNALAAHNVEGGFGFYLESDKTITQLSSYLDASVQEKLERNSIVMKRNTTKYEQAMLGFFGARNTIADSVVIKDKSAVLMDAFNRYKMDLLNVPNMFQVDLIFIDPKGKELDTSVADNLWLVDGFKITQKIPDQMTTKDASTSDSMVVADAN